MKNNFSIQIKAAILLLVFAMNTLVGFACSVGIDMGFNSTHHPAEEETTEAVIHIHKDGKQHVHTKKNPIITKRVTIANLKAQRMIAATIS